MKPKKSLTAAYELKKIREGFSFVVGCDEVGRGCLAGPVVAAAVGFPVQSEKFKVESLRGVQDSKLLSAEERERMDKIIRQQAMIEWGIGVVSEKIIDKINIHHASLLAMKKAIKNLLEKASCESEKNFGNKSRVGDSKNFFVVLDGKFLIPKFDMQQEAVVNGDAKILSVAAASIIAKVFRDNLMRRLHKKYSDYGFADHKGYATFHHRLAIKKFGLLPTHRKSFCKNYTK